MQTQFYIRRWKRSKKCPLCQNSISLNFWRFGNRHETDHTITRLYRIFFFLWKKRNFSFFPNTSLSNNFFAKMDFALQTNQLKSRSKYSLTWTAILIVDCMMQAFYNTAKEGVAHLTIYWNFRTLTIFPLSLAIFTLALLDIREFEVSTTIWYSECFLQPSLQFLPCFKLLKMINLLFFYLSFNDFFCICKVSYYFKNVINSARP